MFVVSYVDCLFVLVQTDPRLGENFDKQFKSRPVSDTPPDKTAKFILDNMKGTEFGGFSFVNPEFGLDDNDEMMIPEETNAERKN